MIEATNKLTESDKQDIFIFEEKIKKEFYEYFKKVKRLTKDEIINQAYKIAFMTGMTEYLLADEFSMNKIREMTYEYKFLENCYKQYVKEIDKYGQFPYDLRECVRMAMEDDDY